MTANDEIFITGGTGVAGKFACNELEKRNFSLKILVRKLPTEVKFGFQHHHVQGDLSDLLSLQENSKGNKGIVHYACASLPRKGQENPQIDLDAMEVLLKNWENGPFVFISSLDVYGTHPKSAIVDETHPLSGERNPYSAGKISCEEILIEAAKKRGRSDFSIFRAPWIFSPSHASKQHIINRFLMDSKDVISLPGKTQEEWKNLVDSWIDARDLAWLVGESIKMPLGGVGNAIGGQFCWHDFFTELKIAFDLKIPIIHKSHQEVGEYAAELFGQSIVYSGEKVKKYFSFNPRYKLKDTLREAYTASS